jgi:isoleucyl-tRNA synthetase
VEFTAHAEQYIDYTVLPDLKRLGPRLGKRLPEVKKAIGEANPAELLAQMESHGSVTLELPSGPLVLEKEDIQIRLQAKPGWAAAQGSDAVVVLSTEITEALELEGFARELVHAIQNQRKETGCEYTDRIAVAVAGADGRLAKMLTDFDEYIRGETLAVELKAGELVGGQGIALELGGQKIELSVRRIAGEA